MQKTGKAFYIWKSGKKIYTALFCFQRIDIIIDIIQG